MQRWAIDRTFESRSARAFEEYLLRSAIEREIILESVRQKQKKEDIYIYILTYLPS